jgi:hypothetical protein
MAGIKNLIMDAPPLGPYEVLECIGTTAHRVSIPVTWCVHNVFHTSLLVRTKLDTIPSQVLAPEPMWL